MNRAALVVAVAALVGVAARPAPNDPHASQQWGLERIRAPQAWSVSEGRGVTVAVVDSGVDLAHPDLAAAFVRRSDGRVLGIDLVDGDDDPTDEHGHGTMVAGIVAARTGNGYGVASVAPAAQIMPIRVLDENASGTSADVERAIRWAVDHGADVVNLSLEVSGAGGGLIVGEQAPDDAVRYAWQRGVVVVAAAGNDSADFTDYRADTPVVLAGATDRDDRRASFSDTGRADGLVAPGVGIVSTWCNPCGASAGHTIGESQGTSYAAAHVAGALAILRAAGYGPAAAVERLRSTAVDIASPGPDPETGFGRIDVAAAVGLRPGAAAPAQTAPPPRPPPTRAAPPAQQAAGTRTPAERAAPATPVTRRSAAATTATASPSPTPPPSPPPSPSPPSPSPDDPVVGSVVAVEEPPRRGGIVSWAALAAVLLAIDVAALAGWVGAARGGRL